MVTSCPDLKPKLSLIRAHNFVDVELVHVLWCPGRPVADRIERLAKAGLEDEGQALHGDWFRVTAATAIEAISAASRRAYPNLQGLKTHAEMISDLQDMPIDRRDHR